MKKVLSIYLMLSLIMMLFVSCAEDETGVESHSNTESQSLAETTPVTIQQTDETTSEATVTEPSTSSAPTEEIDVSGIIGMSYEEFEEEYGTLIKRGRNATGQWYDIEGVTGLSIYISDNNNMVEWAVITGNNIVINPGIKVGMSSGEVREMISVWDNLAVSQEPSYLKLIRTEVNINGINLRVDWDMLDDVYKDLQEAKNAMFNAGGWTIDDEYQLIDERLQGENARIYKILID